MARPVVQPWLESAIGSRREGEVTVVRLGDALADCQAEADACVVGADALRAALKRLGGRRDDLWAEICGTRTRGLPLTMEALARVPLIAPGRAV